MTDDNYKKLAENLFKKVQPETPKEDHRKDSVDTPVRIITDRDIKENSVQIPSEPQIERKSFGLMSVQSSLDEIKEK